MIGALVGKEVGVVILFQRAVGGAPISGFAPFPVVQIQRHILAGIGVQAPIPAPTAVNKNFVRVHSA